MKRSSFSVQFNWIFQSNWIWFCINSIENAKTQLKNAKTQFENLKTQFENTKTQITGDPLAWTGRAMGSKKTLNAHQNHRLIIWKSPWIWNMTRLYLRLATFDLLWNGKTMHVCGLSQFWQQVKLLFSQSKSDLGQTQIGIEKSKQTHQTWARRLKKIWWKWGLPHSPTRQQANGLVESVRRCTYTASRSFNNKSSF